MPTHLSPGAKVPVFQDGVVPDDYLLDVVVHVFDEQDVVVQGFLVFRVASSLSCCRTFFGNELQAFEHGLVHSAVGIVNQCTYWKMVERPGRGEHILEGSREVGEGLHESNDAFALLDLDLGVFDAADLLFDETGELCCEAVVDLCYGLREEFLVSFFHLRELGFQGEEYADSVQSVLFDSPVDEAL